jgi:hypothetical protein
MKPKLAKKPAVCKHSSKEWKTLENTFLLFARTKIKNEEKGPSKDGQHGWILLTVKVGGRVGRQWKSWNFTGVQVH